MKSARDATFDDGMIDPSTLSKFLERDTFIKSLTWDTTDLKIGGSSPNEYNLDIWTEWQNNPRIKDKLTNFAYLSGDLVVTIRINGSPFQYGRALFAYAPYLENQAGGSWASVNNRNQMAACALGWWNAASSPKGFHQLPVRHFSTYPHGWLDPSGSDTVEIQMPFVWHENAISICGTPSKIRESLGQLVALPVVPLRVCNTNAPTSATITIYARMTNIRIAVPTELAPAAGDERLIDEVKKKATDTLVQEARKLPVIGPMVKASEFGAKVAGGLGKIFGFDKPTMVEETPKMIIRPTDTFAHTSGTEPADTLTTDPKQEVVIDPRVVGLEGEDEMSFASLISREQFLTKTNWVQSGSAQGGGQVLYCGLVSPNMTTIAYGNYYAHNGQDWYAHVDTPGGMIARMFSYWKGSITYRVEVVCTKMHSGRLLLQFDPWHTHATPAVADLHVTDVNARYSQILDLKETTSCEFTINYVSNKPFQKTVNYVESFQWPATEEDTGTQLTNVVSRFDQSVHTGVFTVTVLGELVGPMASDAAERSVDVMIFARCGEDMIFAAPRDEANYNVSQPHNDQDSWTGFVYVPRACDEIFSCCCTSRDKQKQKEDESYFEEIQFLLAQELYPMAGEELQMQTVNNPIDSNNESIFFGEKVGSLRSLGKRYMMEDLVTTSTNDNTYLEEYTRYYPHFPPTHNLDPTVMRPTTFESYFSPWFLCKRGSMRRRFINVGNALQGVGDNYRCFATAERRAWPTTVARYQSAFRYDNGTFALNLRRARNHGANGMAFRDTNINQMMDVVSPWYANTRFALAAHPTNESDPSTDGNATLYMNPTMDHILGVSYSVLGIQKKSGVMTFSAIGDDYACMFYLGSPIVWRWVQATP